MATFRQNKRDKLIIGFILHLHPEYSKNQSQAIRLALEDFVRAHQEEFDAYCKALEAEEAE